MDPIRWLLSPEYRRMTARQKILDAMARGEREKTEIAAFDFDGTIERENSTALTIREGVNHRFFPDSFGEDYEALRLMQRDHDISYEDYDRAMLELFSRHMRGVTVEDLDKLAQIVFQNHRGWRYLFTEALIDYVRPTHRTIIVTGALAQVAGRFARHWQIDYCDASTLEIGEDGKFTGETLRCPAQDKHEALTRFAGGSPIDIAIGDTKSDIPMLKLARRPIAFNPVPDLATLAAERDWPVVRERKGCLTVTYREREKLFHALTHARDAVEYALDCRRQIWGWPMLG